MPTITSRALVGRDAELQRLMGLLIEPDPAAASVLLSGDAGVGKTRLLMELRDLARVRGWQVLAGHCLDFGESALPYLPFSEVVGRIAAATPDLLEATAAQWPAITRLQPGRRTRAAGAETDAATDAGDVGHPTDRADLFEAVHALLEAAAERAPVLLVIEDIHWADRSTRDMLGFLFNRGFGGRVQLVVSYRSDDLHRRHPLRRQVAEWARLGGLERMALTPLAEPAVRELVTELAAGGLGEAAVRSIIDRADGNAFFVEELVASQGHAEVPDDLADLLLVRLDPLDDAARQVVRSIAVAGRRVTHDLLAAVVGVSGDTLDAGVRQAVERNVIEAGPRHYSFRHALLAEAVYDDLLPGERVRLHAAYVAALTEGRASGTAAELARHARRATDLDRAASASVEAGDEALAVGGPDEAARHYERALELLADPERAERLGIELSKVVIKAADALGLSGATQRAAELIAAYLARLEPADTSERARLARARLLSQYAGWLTLIESDQDPLALSRDALALAPEGESRLRATVLATHARLLQRAGQPAEAAGVATEALALAERLTMPALASEIATTLGLAGVAGSADGATETAADVRAALEAAVRRADEADANYPGLRARYLLARSYQDAGEWGPAEDWFAAAMELGRRSGLQWAPYALESRWQLAVIRSLRGDWDAAMGLVTTAGAAPEIPSAILEPVRLGILAARGEDVDDALRRLRAVWPEEGVVAVYSAGVEIEVAAARRDATAAVAAYDEAAAMLRSLWTEHFGGRVRLAALAVDAVARAMSTASGAERACLAAVADRLLAEGEAVREHHLAGGGQWTADGAAWSVEGQAWTARLRAEHARVQWLAGPAATVPASRETLVAAWERAVAAFDAFGHVPVTARLRASYAGVLQALGDSAAAARERTAALEVARRLGDRVVLDDLATGPAAADDAGGPRGTRLTAREREILALVAEGRSNGDIGTLLFISTKTVSVHVSNILAKLGAGGRTEAAAIARRDGLLE